jgi:small-conductance mechanosensitive channel
MRSVLLASVLIASSSTLAAQTSAVPTGQTQPSPTLGAALGIERAAEPAVVTYFNRPIVTLRAAVGGRSPQERATAVVRLLDDLVDRGITGPVTARSVEGGSLLYVESGLVLGLSAVDADELVGETPAGIAAAAVARLQIALDEAAEARQVRTLLREGGIALAGVAVGGLVIWALGRVRRVATARLEAIAERTAARTGLASRAVLRASRVLDYQRGVVIAVTVALQLVVLYGVVTFGLRQFPYTRPWGESLSAFLASTLAGLGLGILYAIPGLFTVFLIVVITQFAVRLLRLFFQAVERGAIRLSWLHPETAAPTRRLVTILLWLFAVIVAFPHLPGSGTDVFKGVSVFVGLVVSLSATGLMNQVMSGFVVTYSRALRVGNYMRIGDVEGTVTHLGVLSTKVRTLMDEEVTIPHAVVVSQTATNYSRSRDAHPSAVLTPVAVTIGYEAPWRQVHALLLQAAERTAGLRAEPKAHVLQTALEDFYVRYTLYIALERQEDRLITIDALNRNIQDLFNEYGVQIMSPNYMVDPAAKKVVPKSQWFATPAKPEARSP